jgi:hypothetical protein
MVASPSSSVICHHLLVVRLTWLYITQGFHNVIELTSISGGWDIPGTPQYNIITILRCRYPVPKQTGFWQTFGQFAASPYFVMQISFVANLRRRELLANNSGKIVANIMFAANPVRIWKIDPFFGYCVL